MDKYFVIGPSTQIEHGIVGETEVARWKDYLQREGQPQLKVAAEARSTLRAERVLPPQDPEADIEFLLELFEPEFEFVDPPVWRSVNHPVLMGSRDAEIARAVVARTGLEGRARERAILTLMCPWVASLIWRPGRFGP